MSWWRYEKSTGRGRWLISSEASIWIFLLLTLGAFVAMTTAANFVAYTARFLAGE